ncbi:hypothetical protein QBC35DRAFT_467725 [Podospora australis]|uniref:Uncharacterized protein n=1 Tax=Podospora australis TaxID=1536484 RepID=A0AAN6WKG5_9PEZI|nr:hypothetical protein QBC35DRAFT_467725 [Podospora australis]
MTSNDEKSEWTTVEKKKKPKKTFAAPSKTEITVGFTHEPSRTKSAEDLVKAILVRLGAPSGFETFHAGGRIDPNAPEHLTVVLLDPEGNHISTKHINRSGRGC